MTHHTIDYAAKMHERGYRVTPSANSSWMLFVRAGGILRRKKSTKRSMPRRPPSISRPSTGRWAF